MRQYLDLLKKIMDEGIENANDRTGLGRKSIFGTQLRFDLSKGEFPLVTTRKIYTKAIITELLWFIKGDTDNKNLTDNNVKIWSPWAVTKEHISKFIEKHITNKVNVEADPKVVNNFGLDDAYNHFENKIGPMYGAMWRNAPGENYNPIGKEITLKDIPSDKLKQYKEDYSKFYDVKSSLDESDANFVDYATGVYTQTIDQLQNLITGLKLRPHSARHIVSAWIPQFLPFEENTPHENVLIGKGSLAPCHAIFQCFVNPPKVGGGKMRLSLWMFQRKSNCAFN